MDIVRALLPSGASGFLAGEYQTVAYPIYLFFQLLAKKKKTESRKERKKGTVLTPVVVRFRASSYAVLGSSTVDRVLRTAFLNHSLIVVGRISEAPI